MNEPAARDIVLVRALESADGAQQWFGAARAADADAWRHDDAETWLARRAAALLERAQAAHPAVARARRAGAWPAWLSAAVMALAFVAGLALDGVGAERRINLLAFPLLGMLAWNLAVYAILAVAALRPRRAPGAAVRRPLARALAGLAATLGGGVGRGAAPALARFASDWGALAGPLHAARGAATLHLAAALLALGAIVGLFARGVAFEYLAGWESTFLDAAAVHGLLTAVLGPASTIAGVALPDVAGVAALRWGPGQPGENAADWIGLYAVTVALAVILPRLALAGWCAALARRRARDFPLSLDDAYTRRLLARRQGRAAQVLAVPYAYTPPPQAAAMLAESLEGGAAGDVRVLAPVAYGDEDALPPDLLPGAGNTVVAAVGLFNLAATPERENHGVFWQALRARLAPLPLAVVVDASAYRARLGAQAGAEGRLEERARAWEAMFATLGETPVVTDLTAPDAAARAALARVLGAARPEAAVHG